ncbi:MAG: hypothetical protein CM15mP78_04080 [Candidatus Poseidoniales archaeon]|nr:MAG: hypothetical protein CM15mP78_04080 [Candidatus Poseidoniales archaeon]
MRFQHLIEAAAAGEVQPAADLRAFVDGVANGAVSTEVATAWLKAVHQHGMATEDTVVLTRAMIDSGASLSWGEGPPVVDKHSTGGVGDKMSLMLAPALAAAGCRVPMLAGRGLGHTGGTIDKLESIPGFNCALDPQAMMEAVENVGCCIAVQNEAIAPADGVLYAIRDVTDTIDSVPSSPLPSSQKAAEGLSALVLDVKTGRAAFMKLRRRRVNWPLQWFRRRKGWASKPWPNSPPWTNRSAPTWATPWRSSKAFKCCRERGHPIRESSWSCRGPPCSP